MSYLSACEDSHAPFLFDRKFFSITEIPLVEGAAKHYVKQGLDLHTQKQACAGLGLVLAGARVASRARARASVELVLGLEPVLLVGRANVGLVQD